ncbi:MAG: threonine synthase, partial [Actinomycetota bacterium]
MAGGHGRGRAARLRDAPGARGSVPARGHRPAPPAGGRGGPQHPSRRGRGMTSSQWRGVIEEYRDHLPVGLDTPVVTLCEGGTPLVRSESLSAETGCEVFLKFEGANPT